MTHQVTSVNTQVDEANGRIDITQSPKSPQLPINYTHPSVITIGIPHHSDGEYWSVYLNGELLTPTPEVK